MDLTNFWLLFDVCSKDLIMAVIIKLSERGTHLCVAAAKNPQITLNVPSHNVRESGKVILDPRLV